MVNHNIVAEFAMILCGNNSPRCGCINGDDSALCGDIHAIMFSAVADGGIGRGIEFCGNGTAVNRPTARCIAQCCQIGYGICNSRKGNACFIHQKAHLIQMGGKSRCLIIGCADEGSKGRSCRLCSLCGCQCRCHSG